MKSRLASVRAAGGLDRVNCAVHLLEDEWQRHGQVQLRQFWNQPRCRAAVDSLDAVDVLAELVKADLRCRFERGQSPSVDEYLEQFPDLRAADSRVVSLIYEEYCLNEERGTAPDIDSFCERYPDWKSSLVSQLQYHRLFSQAAGGRPPRPRFPEIGEDFEEFRLLSLLGAGGMSRVFLARDLSLGGKQVVLKVTLDRGQEPKVQGSLDHPHIVPVNSVIYPAQGELCGLSMPYRAGLPLDDLIARIDPARRPGKAIEIWQALVSGTDEWSRAVASVGEGRSDLPVFAKSPSPRGDGWEGFPAQGTYAQGAAWIVMVLAHALHYAHGKQTYHRDVKPGNILLTLHHGPQLLDFNLAESAQSTDHAQAALHGGTLPYMAPEQIEAFISPDRWDRVGAKADIYSLGLVLRELLTGQKPELPDPATSPRGALDATLDSRSHFDPSVRRLNPEIPHALEAIVSKTLSLSPEDRYGSADALAHDLDRFLKRQPLTHVVNPSHQERLSNWMARRRTALIRAACVMVAGVSYLGFEALLPVPIEESAAFAAAVRLFDMEQSPAEAVAQFRALKAANPQSAMVKFYLAFSLRAVEKHGDGEKRYNEADQYLCEALTAPDVDRSAKSWFSDHPRFDTYLVDFADSRIQRADNFAAKHDNGNNDSDEERDIELRQDTYQMARDLLSLAEKLNPGCLKTQRLLATTEKYFDEFGPAYRRISTVIAAYAPGTKNDTLFFSRQMRAWLACVWAEHEYKNRQVSLDTRARLRQADDDYEYCLHYLAEHDFGKSDQVRKTYFILQHRLRTTVTLAEVELDLAMAKEAALHLAEGEELLRKVNDYIKSNDLRVAKTTRLAERLRDGRKRVQAERKSNDLAANGPLVH